jgi:hypothetical protein
MTDLLAALPLIKRILLLPKLRNCLPLGGFDLVAKADGFSPTASALFHID